MTNKETSEFNFDSSLIPSDSGCYLFYDEEDHLLYVGKAKNLKKRVSQYFQKNNQGPKVTLMVSKIRRIETRIVNAEIEALILENNLIKEHKPKFNILLRDDKNFTYLRVTNEEEPKLEIVRRVIKDGSTYFGPKTSTKEFRETVKFCQKFFGAKMIKSNQDYYINQLLGKELPLEEYQQNIERMKKFLRGNTDEVIKELQERMMNFAADKNFEAAARVRDTMQSIDKSTQRQTVEFTDLIDRDFINFYQEGRHVYVVVMAFRQGKFRDLNRISLNGAEFNDYAEIMTNFLTQFYERVIELPREIYIPEPLENIETITKFLEENFNKGQKIDLLIPQKGNKKTILELARKNAKQEAQKANLEAQSQAENFAKALPELAKALDLKESPKRIECYDISHLSGTHTVASMVVFEDGKPKNSEYRRFKIKTLKDGKIDDFAAMKEVVERRFKRIDTDKKEIVITMKPVGTEAEWDNYHQIREHEIFLPHNGPDFEYNREHPDESKKNNHPMIFLLDKKIIGVVRLDHQTKTRLIMRVFGFNKKYQRQGLGTQAIELIENYALEQGFKSLVLNANEQAVEFYKKQNFEEGFWKGDSKDCSCKPMGKKLIAKKDKWMLPNLVVIDGGKGQLSSTMKVFENLKVEGFDPQTQIISLAKREEQIFKPGCSDPIELDFENPGLQLLQRLRDEAHRFAISFNRSLRQKNQTKSALDDVNGVGSATKKKLMQYFETVANIRDASDDELLKIVNQKQLNNLRRQL